MGGGIQNEHIFHYFSTQAPFGTIDSDEPETEIISEVEGNANRHNIMEKISVDSLRSVFWCFKKTNDPEDMDTEATDSEEKPMSIQEPSQEKRIPMVNR